MHVSNASPNLIKYRRNAQASTGWWVKRISLCSRSVATWGGHFRATASWNVPVSTFSYPFHKVMSHYESSLLICLSLLVTSLMCAVFLCRVVDNTHALYCTSLSYYWALGSTTEVQDPSLSRFKEIQFIFNSFPQHILYLQIFLVECGYYVRQKSL